MTKVIEAPPSLDDTSFEQIFEALAVPRAGAPLGDLAGQFEVGVLDCRNAQAWHVGYTFDHRLAQQTDSGET